MCGCSHFLHSYRGFHNTSPRCCRVLGINKLFANDGDPMLFIDYRFASNFVATQLWNSRHFFNHFAFARVEVSRTPNYTPMTLSIRYVYLAFLCSTWWTAKRSQVLQLHGRFVNLEARWEAAAVSTVSGRRRCSIAASAVHSPVINGRRPTARTQDLDGFL